jgi:hypothetical protein
LTVIVTRKVSLARAVPQGFDALLADKQLLHQLLGV